MVKEVVSGTGKDARRTDQNISSRVQKIQRASDTVAKFSSLLEKSLETGRLKSFETSQGKSFGM